LIGLQIQAVSKKSTLYTFQQIFSNRSSGKMLIKDFISKPNHSTKNIPFMLNKLGTSFLSILKDSFNEKDTNLKRIVLDIADEN